MSFLFRAVVATVLLASCASAQSLTTLFARDNGGNPGGAVYFDLTVLNPGGIVVTHVDTNTAETVPLTLDVYINRTGGYAGNETNPSAWTLVSSGVGSGQGRDLPTPVDVADFELPIGTFGIALVLSANAGHDYTNGNATNRSYSNADVRIDCGSASNVPFAGSVFGPRVWNGTLYYSGAGNGVASSGVYGEGCPGSMGLVAELTSNRPRLGGTFDAMLANVPTSVSSAVVFTGVSKSSYGPLTLPFDLGVVGAPGCMVYCDYLYDSPIAVSGGTARLRVPIPSQPSLLSARFYNQAVTVDRGVNWLGLAFSNGHEATIGN